MTQQEIINSAKEKQRRERGMSGWCFQLCTWRRGAVIRDVTWWRLGDSSTNIIMQPLQSNTHIHTQWTSWITDHSQINPWILQSFRSNRGCSVSPHKILVELCGYWCVLDGSRSLWPIVIVSVTPVFMEEFDQLQEMFSSKFFQRSKFYIPSPPLYKNLWLDNWNLNNN